MQMIERLLLDRGITPRKVADTHGGEFASPCPLCGGKDRFRIWPEQGRGGTWYCRVCDKGGDCIEFLRVFDGLSFGAACKKLGVERRINPSVLPKSIRAAPFVPVDKVSLPATDWVEKAGKLLACAEKSLASNSAMLDNLFWRGLPPPAVKRFRLGWLPGQKESGCYYRDRVSWGLPEEPGKYGRSKPLWIPAGLFIPAFAPDGSITRLRVRRDDALRSRFCPEMKYMVIPGSSMHPLLVNPDARAFVVVESELDAMACAFACEEAGLSVGALAVGTNMGKPDTIAHAALEKSLAILVALDFDEPGKDGIRPGANGFAFWEKTYKQARRWPVPMGKDPGEAVSLGVDLSVWILSGLPPVLRLRSAVRAVVGCDHAQSPKKEVDAVTDFSGLLQKEGFTENEKAPCEDEPLTPALASAIFVKPQKYWLSAPAGPASVLEPLAAVGLSVKKTVIDGQRDFIITGQERWPFDGQMAVFSWVHNYGAWVWQALYGVENEN